MSHLAKTTHSNQITAAKYQKLHLNSEIFMGNVVCFNLNPIKEILFASYMWIKFGMYL